MFDHLRQCWTGLEMTAEELKDIQLEYTGHMMRREAWLDHQKLSWWKKLLVKSPPYEAPRGIFLTDND